MGKKHNTGRANNNDQILEDTSTSFAEDKDQTVRPFNQWGLEDVLVLDPKRAGLAIRVNSRQPNKGVTRNTPIVGARGSLAEDGEGRFQDYAAAFYFVDHEKLKSADLSEAISLDKLDSGLPDSGDFMALIEELRRYIFEKAQGVARAVQADLADKERREADRQFRGTTKEREARTTQFAAGIKPRVVKRVESDPSDIDAN